MLYCDGKDKLCKARKVDIKLRDLKMIVRGKLIKIKILKHTSCFSL